MSERPRFVIPPSERDKQRTAIDPRASVWVSANAGSGKTTILTRRVVRLLLSGVRPGSILCLTFTRVAAAEMQNRVFDTLGAWVTLGDADLRAALTDIEGRVPSAERLRLARRLFAQALETPGGLKIQTIHAFCERLLHLFPFEANVPARFRLMDDSEQGAIIETCLDETLGGLPASDPHAERFAAALALVADEAGSRSFLPTLRQAMVERAALGAAAAEAIGGSSSLLGERLGLVPGEDEATIDRETLSGQHRSDRWPDTAAQLELHGSSNDRKLAAALREALAEPTVAARAAAYRALFFTGNGKKLRESMTTKAIPADIAAVLDAERLRMPALIERYKAAATVTRTAALLMVAGHAGSLYAAEKRKRGLLDFDDLIDKASGLLDRIDARWILYKLDSGIEHLLIDEAQDTSPAQWRIMTALSAEFFAGKGQTEAHRTIFAVGDEKQSIFSFQGAAPEQFDAQRALFRRRVEEAERVFAPVELQLSFRTVGDVLSAVDTVFTGERYQGLGSLATGATVHETARGDDPGLVELWPMEMPEDETPIDEEAEVDALPPLATEVKLASRIARRIAHWLRSAARYEDDGARIKPGDVMILVRKRGPFFENVIRALKREGVPVAGADRIEITAHIAVMDLLAAAEAALLPEDDLTLATVLKSPLIGLDDDDLVDLRDDRGKVGLAASLAAATEPRFRAAHDTLARWRGMAREATPFAFFAQLLGAEGGRARLLARLGPDAAEVIDVFLADVLAWKARNTVSLFAFVEAMRGAGRVVKRELSGGVDAVRVMTVHAAKGLEARIVFLPDTLSGLHSSQEPVLFDLKPPKSHESVAPDPPLLAWSPSAKYDVPAVAERREAWRRGQFAEMRRLLYVGMTRARDRLYIAALANKRAPPDDAWYRLLNPTLTEHAQATVGPAEDDPDHQVWQWRSGNRRPSAPAQPDAVAIPPAPLPDWLTRPPPVEGAPFSPLRPSDAVTTARPGQGGAARVQGVLMHALLEALPDVRPDHRRAAATRLLREKRDLDASSQTAMIDGVLALLADPRFAPLFGPASRGEVEIAGTLEIGGHRQAVSARIDRLAVLETEVWIADYKTGRPPPGGTIPPAMLRQLALYRALVGAIYPGRTVRAAILWTASPALVFADASALDAASMAEALRP